MACIEYENVHRKYAIVAAGQPDWFHYRITWQVAILPQMQETAFYSAWANAVSYGGDFQPLTANAADDDLARTISTPVPSYFCPSRRAPAAYPGQVRIQHGFGHASVFKAPVSLSDYVLNRGSTDIVYPPRPGIAEWPQITFTDIQLVKSIRAKDVTDGLSKTYLAGEKAIARDAYEAIPPWDSEIGGIFQCSGGDSECSRTAVMPPAPDPSVTAYPFNNGLIEAPFGSAHPSTCNLVFCDGSVHSISYNIDLTTHQALATRAGRRDGGCVEILNGPIRSN